MKILAGCQDRLIEGQPLEGHAQSASKTKAVAIPPGTHAAKTPDKGTDIRVRLRTEPCPQTGKTPERRRRRMDTRTVRFSPRIEQLRNHLPAHATPPFRMQHRDPTTLAGGRRR